MWDAFRKPFVASENVSHSILSDILLGLWGVDVMRS